ncbi:SymE family type I addiction module toxin [Clostridium formicaceticum]|uniref:Toxin SymE-like domain-containing protein n=1 Tax=Clostridium formicaceticum TaxID=1497 RepID=A0AAC9RJT3_9CLOT|nr:SymE family type I addiction module toxin [Clostridium formicaceticum]ARE86378.1 hypothetical protein CLFO_07000 [Clostridium formicaceticum]
MKVRLLTVFSVTANDSEVPQIRLQGKWLEKLGFRYGKKIIVEEKAGQLLIKLVAIEGE